MSDPFQKNIGIQTKISDENKSEWRKIVPGLLSGAVTTIIFHPLDVAKVRLQVNEGTGVVSYRPKSDRMIGTLKEVYLNRGIRGLYQGLSPNFWGATISWGSFFYLYDKTKLFFYHQNNNKDLTSWQYSASALISSSLTQLISNPIWLAKTQSILHYESLKDQQPKGILQILHDNYKLNGVRGLYRGLIPGLLGISHGSIQFLLYENGKNYLNLTYHKKNIESNLSGIEYSLLGSVSKLTATTVTYPFQLLKSRLQDQHRQFNSIFQLIKEISRLEGLPGFYKGIMPNLIRTAPAAAVTFVVYEKTKMLL